MRKTVHPTKGKKSNNKKRQKKVLKTSNSVVDLTLKSARWLYRHLNLVILLISAVVLLTLVFAENPERRGDGIEYYQMMISLSSHGTPDLRESDIAEYNQLRAETAKTSLTFKQDLLANVTPYSGYLQANSGKLYSIHFWLYSLSAVPVKWFLQVSGIDELKAFQITNALFVIFALAIVLFQSGFSKFKKWLFSAFILFCPALWYLGWSNPEVFSYSLVVASIAFFTGKKHYLAIFFAALASSQNPPIIILVLFFLIYSLADVLRNRQWVKTGLLIASALPVIAPMVFYYLNYGNPNLIYKTGGASLSAISFQRTMSFFFDLNQGVLPYLPGVLVLFAFFLFRNWRQKKWRIYELSLIIILMVLMAETTTNWNSDTEGIMRYAVWILPLFIWGVIEGSNLSLKTDKIMLGVVLVVQILIVISFPSWFIAQKESLQDPAIHVQHNFLASYILRNYPSLYNPVPEIFVERTLGKEVWYDQVNYLPVIYFKSDGTVTKILTDYSTLVDLPSYGDIDPGFLQRQKDSHQEDTDLFYLNLSRGDMQFIAQNKPLSTFNAEIHVKNQPENMEINTAYQLLVTVNNAGAETWYTFGKYPIYLSFHLFDEKQNPVKSDNLPESIRHRIEPGEQITIPVNLLTPAKPGIYLVEFDLIQENVAWFKNKGSKTAVIKIDVR